MLGVLVTDFTAEKVDVATQTSKELQVNIKDSKYVFDIGEEVKVIVNNKLYSGVVKAVKGKTIIIDTGEVILEMKKKELKKI